MLLRRLRAQSYYSELGSIETYKKHYREYHDRSQPTHA